MGDNGLQVGISTPWDFSSIDAASQRQRLVDIADSGLDFVFTADHVSFHNGGGMDGLIRLAVMSGLEPRLGLHLGVYLLALRHPMTVARQIATLCETAPGRLSIGIGVGGEDRHEFEVCDVDPATRGRRTDAGLAIVRALLDGETVDGDGEFFTFQKGRIRPVPNPRVPFVVGGRSNAALERTAKFGDGWLATWCSSKRFAEGIAMVETLGGQRDVAWRHGMQLWVGVGSDPDDARRHVATRMADFYKLDFQAFARYTPIGNAEQIADFLRPYVEAGASTLNLTPCGADPAIEVDTIARVKELLTT